LGSPSRRLPGKARAAEEMRYWGGKKKTENKTSKECRKKKKNKIMIKYFISN
jgi:hypothetical protein